MTNPLYRDMANTDFMTELKNRNSYETAEPGCKEEMEWPDSGSDRCEQSEAGK